MRAGLAGDCRQLFSHLTVDFFHLLNCWLPVLSYEDIANPLENAPYCPAVYLWIGSIEIADGLHEPEAYSFANVPFVLEAGGVSFESNREPELEGHVESRSPWFALVRLDSGKVMD